MARTTTTEYTCDLCGKAWTNTRRISHELPGIDDSMAATFTVSSVGTPPDYCGECIAHVEDARDRAVEERRTLAPEPSE